jgi:hypothetical protein
MKKIDNTYTIEDCGCYVDGAEGIYATDRVVEFARAHGAVIEHDKDCQHYETCFDSEFAGCEFAGDYEDEADTYMNDHHPVDGAFWGRNENGDWGLWSVEDED